MPRTITLAPSAKQDLAAVRDWLLQPGAGQRARQRLADIRQAIRDLRQAPCLWPVVDHPGVREIPISGYRVMYEVTPDTGHNTTAGDIEILRIFGPGQDRSQL
jgi:plasmid stabilization system protein ParE